MSLYLVTGGSGFIGSNLVHALVARGEQVRILDNLSTGREINIRGLLDDPARGKQVELLRGDLTDPDILTRALAGVDYILHQAALPSVPRSVDRPLDTNHVNVTGTLLLLEAARRQGKVRRLVMASSSSVYGERHPEEAKVETMTPMPLSPYAVSKLTGEHYLLVYSRLHGLPTVALRYFNVFGPRQDPNSQYAAALPNFIRGYMRGQAATIYGDGMQSRDFCFIENVVEANLLACEAPAERVTGQVCNIACGDSISLLGVLDLLGEIFGQRIPPQHLPGRPGDVRHSRANIDKARALLGYQGRIKFAEGLRRTVAWYREQT